MDTVNPTNTRRVRHGFERERLSFATSGPSRTKQSFTKECDINNIMARYEKDGLITHVNRYGGQYGDFTDAPSFQDAMNKVIAAQDMFMSLPAEVRGRFGNDPHQFLEFVGNPENKDEMRKLGLLKPERKVPDPVKVEVINPAAPEVKAS